MARENDIWNHDARLNYTRLEEWSKQAGGRPLTIVTVGKSGVGKSTLINNFLKLKDDEACPTGDGASITTAHIAMKEIEKESIVIQVFDTPGLGGIGEVKMADVFKHVKKRTDGKFDILLYCISMHPSANIDSVDIKIIQAITAAFGPGIWLRTILALTFADAYSHNDQSTKYETHISGYAKLFQRALCKAEITDISVQSVFSDEAEPRSIPIIPVSCSFIKLPHSSNWASLLLAEALKKSDPTQTIEISKSSHMVRVAEFIGSVMAGMAVGAAIGTTIGAPFMGIGIIIGPAIGVAVGGATGSVIPIIFYTVQKRRKYLQAAKQRNYY